MAEPMTLDEALAELSATRDIVQNLRRRNTDLTYMLQAAVQMLGPKALQVWQMWKDKGVKRIHTSWGPDSVDLTGEARAQAHLNFEQAAKTAVLVHDVGSIGFAKVDFREPYDD